MSAHTEEELMATLAIWEAAGIEETWAPQESLRGGTLPSTHEGFQKALPKMQLGSQRDDELQYIEGLGAGGMGRVDLAFQRSLRRQVAVKVLHSDRLQQRDATGRMLEEAYLTGRLSHPNIIPVYSLGYDEKDGPILVMKRVVGRSWRQLLDEDSASLEQHLEILMQVCRAVEFAHSKGVLHLDIKPDNVMLGDFGEVYLVDWGVAVEKQKLQQFPEGSVVGTPAYMAPEMTKGLHAVDERTDVYLLGSTLHELLTGEARHVGEMLPVVVLAAIRSKAHSYEAHIPHELGALCNRACHADPQERFGSAEELREALAEYLRRRAFHELLDASIQRASELQQKLDSEGHEYDPQIQALAGECRFGFQQALREWPEHTRARAAYQDFLEQMFGYELRHRHPGAAQAYLLAMPKERPEFQGQLDHLQGQIDEEKRAHEMLLQLQQEANLRDDSYLHSKMLLVLGALWVVGCVWAGVLVLRGSLVITREGNFWIGVGILGVFVVSLGLLHRHVSTSKRLAQTASLLAAVLVGWVLNRSLGMLMLLPVSSTFATDMLLGVAYGVLLVAHLEEPVGWAIVAAAVLAAYAIALWPQATLFFLGAVVFVLHLTFAWIVRPREGDVPGRQRAKDPKSPEAA